MTEDKPIAKPIIDDATREKWRLCSLARSTCRMMWTAF